MISTNNLYAVIHSPLVERIPICIFGAFLSLFFSYGIVNFTRSGKGELKNSSAKEHKLLLVKYLPQLIREATNITDKPSKKPTHKKEHFYYLHTQASVDGKLIPVEITLIRRNNGEIQYYNHILPSEENKKDVVVSTEPVPGNPAYGPPSIPTSFDNNNVP